MKALFSRLLKHQWAVVGGLAVTAFVLGMIGLFKLREPGVDLDAEWWADAVYFSLRLFGFNYDLGGDSADPYDDNWQLRVARFLAPASTALAVIKAAALSLASRFSLWRVGRWKGHAVVCGAGERGTHVALSLLHERYRVVVVERDEAGDLLGRLRNAGVVVIRGCVTDPATLASARVDTAEVVVALTPRFESNLEVVLAASRRRGGLPVHALAYAPRTFATMFEGQKPFLREAPAEQATGGGDRGTTDEFGFFDHHACAARAIAAKHLPDLGPQLFRERRAARILVAGDGEFLPELLGVLIAQCQYVGSDLPRITLVAVDEDAVARGFPLRHPQMPLVADLRRLRLPLAGILSLDLAAPNLKAGGKPFDLVFAACREDGDTLSLAKNFAQQQSMAVRVVACLAPSTQLEQSFEQYFGNPQPLPGVTIHNLLSLGCETRHVVRQELDREAQAIHAKYLASQHTTAPKTLADQPWDRLRGDFRQANRSQADHRAIKRRILELSQSEETIELLAEAEHQRWMADRIFSGWRFGPIRSDEKRLHDCIVPYAELSEQFKRKDRAAVVTARDGL